MAELIQGPVEVRVFESAAELMKAAAREVLESALQAVSGRGRFTWALSGGSTPRGLYRLLASDPFRGRMPWQAIHFFWGDERHVPPDHPESNFRMAKEALLDAVPAPAANVHRIHAEEPDAERAAAEYEAEIRSFFDLAPGPPGDWPRFDLVLLGLGKDGHTASLFPGGAAVHERERLVVAAWIETQKTWRITLTPPVLNHARRSAFLVSGEDKAQALHAVVTEGDGERNPDRCPAQVVEGNRLWMVDRAAARLLARR
ncbi:MAG TPA: 6-phosphogluconolactonase [Thermoanaerobaculia bacterium]|jgi:6-phosphogluconolactonase|nr:6-phosphogluconolactonase [Thermoanaerobaculia bacterium]